MDRPSSRIRMEARGAKIFGGPSDLDAKVGEVTLRAPGYPAEEVAKIWAWALDPMFPTLAELRNALREIARRADCPPPIAERLFDLSGKAHAALPVPTIGDAASPPSSIPGYEIRPAHRLSSILGVAPRCGTCIHSRKTFAESPCYDCALNCAAFGTKPGFQSAATEGSAP